MVAQLQIISDKLFISLLRSLLHMRKFTHKLSMHSYLVGLENYTLARVLRYVPALSMRAVNGLKRLHARVGSSEH